MSTRYLLCVTSLIVSLLIPLDGWAQLTTPHFKRIDQEDGLSQGTVRQIVQDAKGFIWLGTVSGLNRYDGYQFQVYKQDDQKPGALMHNSIRTLFSDRDGRLWVGHPSGLDFLRPDATEFQHFSHDPKGMDTLSAGMVNVLNQGRDGHIWAGHIPVSVSRLNPETLEIKRYACRSFDIASETEDGVSAIHVDPQGRIWIGTMKGGLQVYNPENDRIEPVAVANQILKKKSISSMANHPREGIWVGTRDHGLFHYNPNQNTMTLELSIPWDILSIFQEPSGRLWLGTAGNGVWMREPGAETLDRFRHDPIDSSSLSDSKVFTIFQDEGKLLWFGTNNGVSILNPLSQVFKHYRHNSAANGLSHNRIKAIYEDSQGVLWIGTYGGGLNALDSSRHAITQYQTDLENPASIQSNDIFAIHEDRQNRLWMGSYGSGLSLLDRETGKFQHHPYPNAAPNSPSHKIYSLGENPEGELLMGTGAGLLKYNPATKTFTPAAENNFGPGNQTVRTFCFDKNGNLWAGTFLNGLFRGAPNGYFTNFRHLRNDPTSLVNNQVACVYETESGQIWAGSKNGLSLFHPEKEVFTNYSIRDGLPDQDIYAILEDNDHLLWLSTNNGLSRFNPRDLTFINFDVSDGLQGPEFNSGASFKLRTGELAFGGTNGLNLFHPAHIGPNSHVPNIELTSFKVLSEERPLPNPLVPIDLTSKDYFIAFEFTALDFANSGKNKYAYKLDGLDLDWNYSTRPSASYTNLDYGEYTLRIKGSNDDGLWNEAGKTFKVRVAPPFYRKSWFYLLAAITFILILYTWDWNHKRTQSRLATMIEERTKSLQEANKELELTNLRLEETAAHLRQTQEQLLESAHKAGMAEIATDILHNLGNGLNGLLVSTEMTRDHIQSQKVGFLEKACLMLEQNKDQLGPFFLEHAPGSKLLQGLHLLSERLDKGKTLALNEIQNLDNLVSKLSSILAAQRKYLFDDRYHQKFDLIHLIEDVLRIQGAVITQLNVEVITQFEEIPELYLAKTKVAHIMNHLIKNACEAMRRIPDPILKITITSPGPNRVVIVIQDNGQGIEQHILERIFSQGYTTKKDGVGGGLHYCANAAIEMKGQIQVASRGIGRGAEFTVTLPISCD